MLQPDEADRCRDEGGSTPSIRWSAVALKTEILAILVGGPEPGEGLGSAFRRKEAELAAAFERLTVPDARELRRRLALALPDDQVAAQFTRLIPQRRVRLLAFLDGARRREALRASGEERLSEQPGAAIRSTRASSKMATTR